MTAVLQTRDLVKRFGGLTATDQVTLDLMPGEIHALIGPNGAGKTTLINLLTGVLPVDGGTIVFSGEDITAMAGPDRALRGLGRSFQITSLFGSMTTLANVSLAVQAKAGHSFRFWRRADRDARLVEPALAALERVGLARQAQIPAQALSHGERRLLEMAMALAGNPQVLLLDEPMAGIGPGETDPIISLIGSFRGRQAVLLVEHDMDAVFALADRISVLVYGRIIATGSPAEIRTDPEVRQAYLGEESP